MYFFFLSALRRPHSYTVGSALVPRLFQVIVNYFNAILDVAASLCFEKVFLESSIRRSEREQRIGKSLLGKSPLFAPAAKSITSQQVPPAGSSPSPSWSFISSVFTDCYQSAAATWKSVNFPPCQGSWQVAQVCYEGTLWRKLGMTPTLPQETQRKASNTCYIKHFHSANHWKE